MRAIVVTLAALAVAAIIGLGSAYFTTLHSPPFGAMRVGPWVAWPQMGSSAIDPYARAVLARSGALPLGLGEGIAFTAMRDSAGQELDSACTYRLRGTVPASRAWTLTVFDAASRLFANETQRNGFTSFELLREPDGTANIVLARAVQAGNWLMLPESRHFQLVLRLYGASVSTMTGVLEDKALPVLERISCP